MHPARRLQPIGPSISLLPNAMGGIAARASQLSLGQTMIMSVWYTEIHNLFTGTVSAVVFLSRAGTAIPG